MDDKKESSMSMSVASAAAAGLRSKAVQAGVVSQQRGAEASRRDERAARKAKSAETEVVISQEGKSRLKADEGYSRALVTDQARADYSARVADLSAAKAVKMNRAALAKPEGTALGSQKPVRKEQTAAAETKRTNADDAVKKEGRAAEAKASQAAAVSRDAENAAAAESSASGGFPDQRSVTAPTAGREKIGGTRKIEDLNIQTDRDAGPVRTGDVATRSAGEKKADSEAPASKTGGEASAAEAARLGAAERRTQTGPFGAVTGASAYEKIFSG